MYTKQRGLTLVELMVVVAVMAILATIAYPVYTSQAQKSRRADAKIALESIALAQERYFTINGEYAATLSSLQVSPDVQGGASDEGYYTITLTRTGADNEQYSARANTSSGAQQSGDTGCAQFALTHQGAKTATSAGCW